MWIKTECFQHIAHASMWLFVKAKRKEFSTPSPITERAPWWLSYSEESRPEKSSDWRTPNWCYHCHGCYNFPFSSLTLHPVEGDSPNRRRSPCCLPSKAVTHLTSCVRVPAKPRLHSSDRHSGWKETTQPRVTASTQKRWRIGRLKFPGPSRMSNIDSFVT